MAIIRCPACNRRMSSLAGACPHCHEPVGDLDPRERQRLVLRRWRARARRARAVTYAAMGLVVAGALVWWLTPPPGLTPPVGMPAAVLLALGIVSYLGGWVWLLYLQSIRPRSRSG